MEEQIYKLRTQTFKGKNTKDKNLVKSIHAQHRSRLLKQVFLSDPNSMTEIQLLEFLLHKCIPVKDTNEIAHRLIKEFGSLSGVLDASLDSLVKTEGVGETAAMSIISIGKVFTYYRESKRLTQNIVLDTPQKIMDFFTDFLESKPNEEFYMACLNAKSEVIKVDKISTGGANSVLISERDLAELALKYNSSVVIIAHNHPQGDPFPSINDLNATIRVLESLNVIAISVFDHVIVGRNECYSFRSSGRLDEIKNEIAKTQRPEFANRILKTLSKPNYIN